MLENAGIPLPPVSSTYDEFRAYLVSIKPLLPSGVYPLMDFGATSSSSTPFGYWLRYNGTPIYDEKTKTTAVTAEVAQKYLDLWKDYRDNGLIPNAEFAAQYPETNSDSSALVAGKVAIGFVVSNQLTGWQTAMTDELGLVELPGAAATKALWPQLSQVMTVNKNSKNIEEVIKFIDFMVNSPDVGRILGNDRGASASSTYRAGISGKPVDEKISAYLDIAGPHSSPETAHLPNDTELNNRLYLSYQQVAFGRIDTVAGGKEIASLIQTLINK
jgi:multiple sugar transport system substrate-binding protein